MERKSRLIFVENTKFIFRTNFAGLPDEKYGSKTRFANILIPEELAEELREEGYTIGETRPREGEEAGFVPKYFTRCIVNYDSDYAKANPPKIYLVETGKEPELLSKDNVGMIDNIYVLNVNATLEKGYLKRYERPVIYVKVMYVEHDENDDPWSETYRSDGQPIEE